MIVTFCSLCLGAKAVKCTEPEQVLKYFHLVNQQAQKTDRVKNTQDSGANLSINKNNANVASDEPKSAKPLSSTSISCFNCSKQKHYGFKCTKKIKKCTVCNKLGHLTTECSRLLTGVSKSDTKENDVMLIKVDNISDKYMMNLKINR